MCKDFCNRCEAQTLAEQWTSFDVMHLYFIPLVPLGWRRRWHCGQCGEDPRARTRTSSVSKKLGLGVLAFLCLLMIFVGWSVPVMPPDEGLSWALRFAFPLAAGLSLYFGFICNTRRNDDVRNALQRSQVLPLSDEDCRVPLLQPVRRCPACGVQVDTSSQR